MNDSTPNDAGDDLEAEAFFETLAGRGSAAGGAAALRAAILAESHVFRAADTAGEMRISSQRDEETLAQLVREGIFTRPQPAPPRFQAWRQRLAELFAARAWASALAACATVALLLVIVPAREAGVEAPEDVLRGGAQNTLAVADPQAHAQALATELQAVGARARLVQLNDTTWSLSVTAPGAEQAAAAVAVLQAKGLQGISRLPADVTIVRKN